MKYFLGVDAGNTKTIAVVAKRNGTIIGYGRGGCGDIYNAGSPARALENVDDAVQSALKQANCSESDILVASFSMAGADWPEDFELIRTALETRGYGGSIQVVNDAVGALKAGAVEGWGVVITAGTGAAIGARAPDGTMWHSSWWQEGGGGRNLGEQALRAVYRSELGLTVPTALSERLLAFYGLASVEALLHQFTRRENACPSNAPDLARLVLDVAQAGDATARAIVTSEGILLADYALAAARKVGIDGKPFPLVLAGNVFKHTSPLLSEVVIGRLGFHVGESVTVCKTELEPCVGALVISLEAAGVQVNGKVRSRLKKSMPGSQFFAT